MVQRAVCRLPQNTACSNCCALQVRAYIVMWKARKELLVQLWDRVETVMLGQPGRAKHGKTLGFRKNLQLSAACGGMNERIARRINDALAQSEVSMSISVQS